MNEAADSLHLKIFLIHAPNYSGQKGRPRNVSHKQIVPKMWTYVHCPFGTYKSQQSSLLARRHASEVTQLNRRQETSRDVPEKSRSLKWQQNSWTLGVCKQNILHEVADLTAVAQPDARLYRFKDRNWNLVT